MRNPFETHHIRLLVAPADPLLKDNLISQSQRANSPKSSFFRSFITNAASMQTLFLRMFNLLLYRKDRIKKINTKIKKKAIKRNFGWCDDPNSSNYNKLVKFPFSQSAERLYLKENIYDLILVINFNTKPIIKRRGSAIFLHIANKKFSATKGCIAIKKKSLIKILPFITRKTRIFIS